MQQAAEVRVGIFVVAALLIGLFIAMNLRGGFAGKARGYEFEIWFEKAPDVGKGSAVRLSGVEIGEVLDKDILVVTESVEIGVPETARPLLPFDRITTWSDGHQGERDAVSLVVRRKPLTAEEARRVEAFQRPRSIARLIVRVRYEYELFERYNYIIRGGLVFGDKYLEINDLGKDGFPLSDEARGASILKLKTEPQPGTRTVRGRVAVLGGSPPDMDKIASNVERIVDEDTVVRAKQVVKNIERATDEAAELVAAFRSTVEGNQPNVDRVMTNAADAAEQIRTGVAEARVLATQTLQNIEKMAAVAKRVSEGNEARLNRIAADIEESSATLARLAKNSESKVDSTMTDVAAIAREVREMVASNREHIDNVAARLSDTADNINALTGDSRERLASILERVDESVGSVRDLLKESDNKLRGMVDDSAALLADARATVGSVKESIGPITDNLRETSEHVATASRNVAELTSDPATRQILNNVERTTAEARELIADIRSLTADPEVQHNLKTTAKNVRVATEGLTNAFGGFAQFKPYATANVFYVPDQSRWQGDVNVSIGTKGKTSFHFGADDITDDPLLNGQLGREIFPRLRVRYGFYRSQLGLGADYDFWPGGRLQTNYYDFEDPHMNARFTYRTPWGITGLVGVEDMFDHFDWTFGIQVGKDLP